MRAGVYTLLLTVDVDVFGLDQDKRKLGCKRSHRAAFEVDGHGGHDGLRRTMASSNQGASDIRAVSD